MIENDVGGRAQWREGSQKSLSLEVTSCMRPGRESPACEGRQRSGSEVALSCVYVFEGLTVSDKLP